MIRSPVQGVKLKRKALGWSATKLATKSGRTLDEIRRFEGGRIREDQLTAELLALVDSAIAQVLPLWVQVMSDPDLMTEGNTGKVTKKLKLLKFARILKDRRNKAQLSRQALAKLAGVSDSTIKFIEVARHPPSRRTCQYLVAVEQLGLTWQDVAMLDYVGPAPSAQAPEISDRADSPLDPELDNAGHTETSAQIMPAPGISDQTENSSRSGERRHDAGEVIEEEVITFVRRTIRR